jgi:hypothetical protein
MIVKEFEEFKPADLTKFPISISVFCGNSPGII